MVEAITVDQTIETFATYPSLKDRVVFITGGATGIGASIVEHFAAQEARVAFVDISAQAGEKHVSTVKEQCGTAPWFKSVDLTEIEALKSAISEVEEDLGPIRVLINNAANDDRHAVHEVTPAYWDDRISVNLKHQFFAAQAVHKSMAAAGGGSIVNLSSIAWMVGLLNTPIYNIAKAGVVGLTKSLAREFGTESIRVNCILPGSIQTQRQLEKWLTPEFIAQILDHQCLKEGLKPPDVARLALWLAADDSRLITAQNFIIDGGWT